MKKIICLLLIFSINTICVGSDDEGKEIYDFNRISSNYRMSGGPIVGQGDVNFNYLQTNGYSWEYQIVNLDEREINSHFTLEKIHRQNHFDFHLTIALNEHFQNDNNQFRNTVKFTLPLTFYEGSVHYYVDGFAHPFFWEVEEGYFDYLQQDLRAQINTIVIDQINEICHLDFQNQDLTGIDDAVFQAANNGTHQLNHDSIVQNFADAFYVRLLPPLQ